jgi:hypothetical protein
MGVAWCDYVARAEDEVGLVEDLKQHLKAAHDHSDEVLGSPEGSMMLKAMIRDE